METGLKWIGRRLVAAILFLAAYEAFVFLRWTFFSGREPSLLHDLQIGLGILLFLWAVTKIGIWFEQREARNKEIAQRLRAMDARIEALYKWGGVGLTTDEEEDNNDWEWELDEKTKAEIAECREGMKDGDTTSRYSLGVIFWNRAMNSYNAHTTDGYREAIRWLRKAASVGYDCEDTLGGVYAKVEDYDEAMYWYRKSVKRGGSHVWIPESNIADMYAEGHGVQVNHAEAAWWWDRAARHGSDWSHYKLGKLYAEGADDFAKDSRKAYFHLCIASSASGQHSPQTSAIELRDKIARELGEYSVSREQKRAEEWLAVHKAEGVVTSQSPRAISASSLLNGSEPRTIA